MRRKDFYNRKDEILKWINNNQSKAFICKNINCKPDTLNSFLKEINVVYKGNRGARGIKTGWNKRSVYDYLKKDGDFINTHYLKTRLIKEKIKEHRCERCHNYEWTGIKIPLELHHIDGEKYNNELSNLQILCPNCHALTANNSGRGVKSYKDKCSAE